MFTDDLIGGNYSPLLSISNDQFVKCELNSDCTFAYKDLKLIDL